MDYVEQLQAALYITLHRKALVSRAYDREFDFLSHALSQGYRYAAKNQDGVVWASINKPSREGDGSLLFTDDGEPVFDARSLPFDFLSTQDEAMTILDCMLKTKKQYQSEAH